MDEYYNYIQISDNYQYQDNVAKVEQTRYRFGEDLELSNQFSLVREKVFVT